MKRGEDKLIRLIKCCDGKEEVLAEAIDSNQDSRKRQIQLRIRADLQDLTFSYSYDNQSYHILKSGVDARILSTDVAGGFVGNTMGLYCSSNGLDSSNYADFDWIKYKNI